MVFNGPDRQFCFRPRHPGADGGIGAPTYRDAGAVSFMNAHLERARSPARAISTKPTASIYRCALPHGNLARQRGAKGDPAPDVQAGTGGSVRADARPDPRGCRPLLLPEAQAMIRNRHRKAGNKIKTPLSVSFPRGETGASFVEETQMICDTLQHLVRYRGLHPNLDTAIDYLLTHDLAALPAGACRRWTRDKVFINLMGATLHRMRATRVPQALC